MEELLFLVNPAAGGGRAGEVWRSLTGARPQLADRRVVQAGSPEEAERRLLAAVEEGTRRVVVVGGDGTIHQAANALIGQGRAEEVALGLVPAGTGSDLARVLEVPRDPEAALDRALAADPRALDALRVRGGSGDRYVVNVASAGVSGGVVVAVNAAPKRGKAVYLLATLRAVFSYRPVACTVWVEGEPWYEGPLFLLAVANGTTFGQGMRIAPRAVPDDGEADLILVGELPRWELPVRLPQLFLGTHVGSRRVRYRRGRQVRLVAGDTLPPLEVDGETFTTGPDVAVEVVPRAWRFAG